VNEIVADRQVIVDHQAARVSVSKVICREIRTTDADGVINLLTRGFSEARGRMFWVAAFSRLASHPTPPGYPRYGYMLEADGEPVGIILLIFTAIEDSAETRILCSVSSWYVDPKYRAFGTLLIACALKHKHITYYNVTPAPHTWEILTAQGYRKFSSGRVVATPILSPPVGGAWTEEFSTDLNLDGGLSSFEIDMLRAHQGYDCLSVICQDDGEAHPFVFSVRSRFGIVRFAFLVYCRSQENFVRLAGTLGRFLARRGILLVILDANGPIPGLVGRYSNRNPKYFKGPSQPRLGNLAYSDRAMFGV
jgi:hypothetical protein